MEQPNQGVKETVEANQPQSQEEKKPLFSGVDSQGKERLFNDVDEAQKSWQSAQNFIKDTVSEKQSLEARIQELEAKLNQSTKLEDALELVKNRQETQQVNDELPQQTTETTPQMDVEQLKAQLLNEVMGQLSESQQAEVYSKNQEESISAAQAVYGQDYEDKLRETAQELGMSDEDIINEAKSSPKRFKKLFGLDKTLNKTYAPSGSVNFSGKPKEKALNLAGGFTSGQRVANAQDNYRIIAEKHGIKLPF